jgi:hypothetical protein
MMHPHFEAVIMTLIILNTLLMASTHFSQPDAYAIFLEVANLFFVVVFTLEALLKILGISFRRYWQGGWNRFDFFVVVSSYAGLISSFGIAASVVRILRIGRVVRLVGRSANLEKLLYTLRLSALSLVNVAALLFLNFFIFAILSVELFGNVKISDGTYIGLSEYANFSNFGYAFMGLFRMATGDAWHELFYGAQIQQPLCDAELDDCGTPYAFIFFNIYMIIGSLVMVNLYIAVILEHFGQQETVELQLAFAQLRRWAKKWNSFDPLANHYVTVNDFMLIMDTNPAPFGFKTGNGIPLSNVQKLHFFNDLNPVLHLKDTSGSEWGKQNTGWHNDGKGFELKKLRAIYRRKLVNKVLIERAGLIDQDDGMDDLYNEFRSTNESKMEWCVDFDSALRMMALKLAGLDVIKPHKEQVLTMSEWYAAHRIQVFWMAARAKRIKVSSTIQREGVAARAVLDTLHHVDREISFLANDVHMHGASFNEAQAEAFAGRMREQANKLRPLFKVAHSTVMEIAEMRQDAIVQRLSEMNRELTLSDKDTLLRGPTNPFEQLDLDLSTPILRIHSGSDEEDSDGDNTGDRQLEKKVKRKQKPPMAGRQWRMERTKRIACGDIMNPAAHFTSYIFHRKEKDFVD